MCGIIDHAEPARAWRFYVGNNRKGRVSGVEVVV
jgi:hypothetical protein